LSASTNRAHTYVDTNPITKFFPTKTPPPPDPPAAEVTDRDVDEAVKRALALAMGPVDTHQEAGEEGASSQFTYEGFRIPDDLPPTATALYNLAGACSVFSAGKPSN
jgi:hypothetical protein